MKEKEKKVKLGKTKDRKTHPKLQTHPKIRKPRTILQRPSPYLCETKPLGKKIQIELFLYFN